MRKSNYSIRCMTSVCFASPHDQRCRQISSGWQGDLTCRFIDQFHHRCDFAILSEIPPASPITIDIDRKWFDWKMGHTGHVQRWGALTQLFLV